VARAGKAVAKFAKFAFIVGVLVDLLLDAEPAGPTEEDLERECEQRKKYCDDAVRKKVDPCKKQERAEHWGYCNECYAICLRNAHRSGADFAWPDDLLQCQYWKYPWKP
jgi:hypothetical protein